MSFQPNQDGRRNNGGARKGAGRPVSDLQRKMLEEHLMKKIVVKEFRHGQMRRVKKTALVAILDDLSRRGLKHGDIKAIRAYFNITLGRPRVMGRGGSGRFRLKTTLRAMAESVTGPLF